MSVSQLARGRRRVADNLPDAVLDNPAAGERYAEVMAAARCDGRKGGTELEREGWGLDDGGRQLAAIKERSDGRGGRKVGSRFHQRVEL